MKIIISPAKKMNEHHEFLDSKQLPALLEKTDLLKEYMKSLSYQELKQLLCCNDRIAELNFLRYKQMNLTQNTVPALLSYTGIAYQYMAPHLFTFKQYEYIECRLRILSGFYGILKPFDGVVPYRLEMQAKLKTAFCSNLYDFWKDSIYRELIADEQTVINLASNEYSKAIKPYLEDGINFITPIFGEYIFGQVIEKGVHVKMARGEMVRFMTENNIECASEIKNFDRLGYRYCNEMSDKTKYVFLK